MKANKLSTGSLLNKLLLGLFIILSLSISAIFLARNFNFLQEEQGKVFSDKLESSREAEIRYLQIKQQNEKLSALFFILIGAIVLTVLLLAVEIIYSFYPLRLLEKGLKKISEGEIPSDRIPAKKSNEISNTIREYNRMTLALVDRESKWKEARSAYQRLQGEVVRLRFVAGHSGNILNSVTLGIFVMTREEIVSLTNSAFHNLWGLNTSLAGLHISQIPFITEQQDWVSGMREVLLNGEEKSLPPLNVGERKLKLLLAPLYDRIEEGDVIGGVVTLCEDITDKILMEERLIQSERLATVGKLAAQVAHEIRNPLNSIGLNADYLIDKICSNKELPENELRTLLDAIRDQVDHLESVTDQYLQMTRSPQAQPKTTSLNELLREIDVIIRPQFSFKGVSLDIILSHSLPNVVIDPSQIRQAILNLLTNALDVSSEGGVVRLEIEMRNNLIEISVQDHGPGIPSENLEKIFLPFYTTKPDGVGLGLALTRQIIAAHSGELLCSTSQNSGTKFTIQLPLNAQ